MTPWVIEVVVLLESEVIAREVQLIQNLSDIKQLWMKRENMISGKEFDSVPFIATCLST